MKSKKFKAMKKLVIPAIAAMLLSAVACTGKSGHDSTPVAQLDLQRFLGTWYEIARFDHSFEKGIDNATAEYSLRDDGKIRVVNSGWKNGERQVAEGKAKCPDPVGNPAHLKVAFFLFFYADYNVLYLDSDYRYMLIGSKSDKYLWILSRMPELEEQDTRILLDEAERRGYDISGLIWVDQSRNIKS